MATKKVTTATLIRGSLYTLRHPKSTPQNPLDSLRFERSVPVVIDDPAIARMLEELYEETTDGDGEVFEKPTFRIDRNVSEPDTETASGPKRLSSTRVIKRRRIAG